MECDIIAHGIILILRSVDMLQEHIVPSSYGWYGWTFWEFMFNNCEDVIAFCSEYNFVGGGGGLLLVDVEKNSSVIIAGMAK